MPGSDRLRATLDFGPAARVGVGQLARAPDGGVLFAFDEEFLDTRMEISPLALPALKRVRKLPKGRLWSVFEDSLPDTWGRTILNRRLKGMGAGRAEPLDPAYDITWGHAGATRHTTLVAGRPDAIAWADCLAVATTVGLKTSVALHALEAVEAATTDWSERAAEAELSEPITKAIQRTIEKRLSEIRPRRP